MIFKFVVYLLLPFLALINPLKIAFAPLMTSFGKIIENPVENIIFTSLGVKQLYSDILYIRLLQYYGTPEEKMEAFEYGSGEYPLFYPMALNIVATDPYYTNAILTGAGVLAFNLDKTYKAISILRFAMIYDNNNYKYLTLLSAIMIKESRKNLYDKSLLDKLYEVSILEETPVILRQITAFLHKKAGKYDKAIEIYDLILKTSKEKYYIENAKRQIDEIKKMI
ncbi:MAG: hypothetical protein K6357_01285 [Elusimicrobiota bacterium]